MGSSIYKQGDNVDYGVVEYIADTRADILTLNTNCAPGSTCLVLADSSVWVLSTTNVWTELK